MTSNIKVYYLSNARTPYKIKFWNELGKLLDLTVFLELSHSKNRDESWEKSGNINYKEIILPNCFKQKDSAFCPTIYKYLNDKNAIKIINGYSTPTGIFSIMYMKLRKIPYILAADGGMITNECLLKFFIKKQILKNAEAYLSSGKITDEYYMKYGIDSKYIYHYPFSSISKSEIIQSLPNKKEKEILRDELSIKYEKMIVSVGQFIYRKGYDILLKACNNLSRDLGIYIFGGNPTKEYIELINQFHLNNVHFFPFIQHDKLYLYLKAADLFVLPTREDIWGLVVNEAMANGLPVITTDKCVAGMEMIPGNPAAGMIIHSEDIEELVKSINYMIYNTDIRIRSAKAALERASYFTIENMARKHYEFICSKRL